MDIQKRDRDLNSEEKEALAKETMISDAGEQYKSMTFSDFNLAPETMRVVDQLGWKHPTHIQAISLPKTLMGQDLAGFAQTGTGKTGAFLITWIEKTLKSRAEGKKSLAVTLVPTRELAVQIEADARQLVGDMPLEILSIFGGMDYEKQASKLREKPDLVVATPGRLKDFHEKKIINLGECDLFICDEADRMLDMGFIEDVEYFLDHIPEGTQKLLFSATTNDTVKELAFEYLNNPDYIFANPEQLTPENIIQYAIHCRAAEKLKVVLGLYRDLKPTISVLFVNTKLVAEWLHYKLNNNGIQADIITGDLAQRKRIQLIKNIKAGNIKVLIATDVASRGLHIAGLSHVFNFDLPDDPSNYIHRVGRTARAGATGAAYTLVCEDYGENLEGINELLGEKLRLHTEWFDQSYLDIEDKAGNPYETGQLATTSGKGASSDKRDRESRGPAKRGGASKRNDRGPKKDGDRNETRGARPPRGNSKTREPRRDDRGPSQTRNSPRKNQPKTQPAAAAKPAENQGSFIKKFFNTIFGRKS